MDKTDRIIADFASGRLKIMIADRREFLSIRKTEENISGSKTNNNVAPQEILVMKFLEDEELQKLECWQRVIERHWDMLEHKTQLYIKLRFKFGDNGWQITDKIYLSKSTLYRKYARFKDELNETNLFGELEGVNQF